QIVKALTDAFKFQTRTGADDPFRLTLENKLWPEDASEVAWTTIKQRAAQDPSWVLHHPRALDNLKDELVQRDIWREAAGYVQRGPFPKPATSVQVQLLSRDEATGQATLRVKPLHGDTVRWSQDGFATIASPQLDVSVDLRTSAVRLSFIAVDSTGDHETGEPVGWTNIITLKHRFFQDGGQRLCE